MLWENAIKVRQKWSVLMQANAWPREAIWKRGVRECRCQRMR